MRGHDSRHYRQPTSWLVRQTRRISKLSGSHLDFLMPTKLKNFRLKYLQPFRSLWGRLEGGGLWFSLRCGKATKISSSASSFREAPSGFLSFGRSRDRGRSRRSLGRGNGKTTGRSSVGSSLRSGARTRGTGCGWMKGVISFSMAGSGRVSAASRGSSGGSMGSSNGFSTSSGSSNDN